MIGAKQTFTVAEVAHLREVCSKSVLNAIHAGELGAYRYSSRLVVVERPDLESWRTPGATPVVINEPKRRRYRPKDIAVEFGIPVRTVRLAVSNQFLVTHRSGSGNIECLARDVATWRETCRRTARAPIARISSGRRAGFPKANSLTLAGDTPAAHSGTRTTQPVTTAALTSIKPARLLTMGAVARRISTQRRVLAKAISRGIVAADFTTDTGIFLFQPHRLDSIRHRLQLST